MTWIKVRARRRGETAAVRATPEIRMRRPVLAPLTLFAAICAGGFALAAVDAAAGDAAHDGHARHSPHEDDLADGLARYVVAAQAAVDAIDADAPVAQQAQALETLADDAIALVEPFVQRFPACGDYLRASTGLREAWRTLSPARIEADYHHDGALPPVADPRERARCYQMKDLVVHPLTARRLLEEPAPDRAALRHEIVEVVAHGGALRAMVSRR
ncbi:hypothetical protein [Arenimonas composti]|uniref:Uncharacterized protein n=1 Tax=Arenimonas composti TR7-09 = DSM 18010 TaxID=1121013 RepID=A0A091BA17_9GAMM|nr:hypothetical protein [Arenimonas composti]KFN49468.1 hypothetical protein P873_10875 [Arenimonas composti TR7-09 = DSM 18010]